MTKPVFFKPNLAKASAAVALIAEPLHRLDRHAADWIAYRADRNHLNRFGRPVLGLRYRNREGLPESLELAELFSSQGEGTACIVSEGIARRRTEVSISYDLFSKSDLAAISASVVDFLSKGRTPRLEEMPVAWCEQTANGWIGYENMLDAGPNRQAWRDDMAAVAPYVRF
ncbi:hypothetical protein O9X98_08615 [Agrobacterium salinitolerans]|nr:hypothetical protein [Agrobacterium salinitolerans]